MRHLCQSAFLAVVVLLAALPHLLADAKSDVQVQLDVVVMSCSRDALAGTTMKSVDQIHWQVISEQEYAELIAAVRGHKSTKIVTEPKIVAMSGRRAIFQSNGQHVGLELKVLPVALANGRIYLELSPRIGTVQRAAGDEQTVRTALEIESGSTVGITVTTDDSSSEDKKSVTLILVTPRATRGPARMPVSAALPETQSDRLKKIAATLADEYRAACEAQDFALAAKLARMALELDPICFHSSPRIPALPPKTMGVVPPPADSSEEAEPMKADYRVPMMMPPIKDPELPCSEQPSEAEILRSLPNVPHEAVEIVCEKLVDKIDALRTFPLLGPAQLHHCHWKCTVYFTDSKTKQKRCEVIYIDKNVLHGTAAEPSEKPTAASANPSINSRVRLYLGTLMPVRYDPEPNERMKQLIKESEDMRQIREECQRILSTEKPTPTSAAEPTGTKLSRWLAKHCSNAYDSDPNVRMQQLINESEDMRQVREEWKRIWFLDQPTNIAPDRVQAGIK